MSEGSSERKKLMKEVLSRMAALKAPPKSNPQAQIESLVKQAEYFAKFLISRVEGAKGGEEEETGTFTRLSEQPSILKGGQLKFYQLVALNWMISLYESGISGILADDMGLGKTIQSISMLAFLKEFKKINGPHIIVAPKITLGNWMKELQKWLPDSRAVKLQATKGERQEGLEVIESGRFDIVVTSFEGVRLCVNKLKKNKNWQYIIIDEAHKIKNEDSQLSQIVRQLTTECRLLLTGTPLQNNLHELWSLMNFLIPSVFESSEPFDNWANLNDLNISPEEKEKKNVQMISQLHKILRPFMLRRTKAEVEKTLPGKKEILIYVGLSEVQLKIYKNLLQNRSASEEEKKYYLNLLMQLRKVCCHPYLFPNIEPEGALVGEHLITASEKLRILDKLLSKLFKEGGHKVLVFSQMTTILDILEDYCNYRGYRYCRIDGSTDMISRDSQIEAFMNTDEHFIFLLSTRAGGLGINLTAADTVVIYDSDFNPQMDLQAMDRAHRIGQKREVRVYRLITQDTVEEKIIERQMIKLKWDSLVIQQQRSAQKNKALSKEEMKEMLQFGANAIFKATSSTVTDEFIDDLLHRGEQKTHSLHQQMEHQLKPPQDLVNLNIDNINIFDFMQRDEEKRRRDREALEEHALREQLQASQLRGRSMKIKQPRVKVEKKIAVSEHHFYHSKERLREILQKEEDYKNNKGMEECPPLTPEEEREKAELLETGFRDWNKSDFTLFISASEKFGRSKYTQIAEALGKPLEAVIAYSETFWQRFGELSEAERILKQIESGEERLENKKQQYELLEWKAERCLSMDFSSTFYAKFKSKLFTIEADRYMAESVLRLGTQNITKLKDCIREESMFRFDHYFRTRNQTELNKRLSSIYKLIEKEKDSELFEGGDRQKCKKKREKVVDENLAMEETKFRKKRKV